MNNLSTIRNETVYFFLTQTFQTLIQIRITFNNNNRIEICESNSNAIQSIDSNRHGHRIHFNSHFTWWNVKCDWKRKMCSRINAWVGEKKGKENRKPNMNKPKPSGGKESDERESKRNSLC